MNPDYPVPFPRSYWVVPGVLLAGEFPGAKDINEARQKIEGLFDSGIRHFINLMEPNETDHSGKPFNSYEKFLKEISQKGRDGVSFARYAIKDLHIPNVNQMTEILDAIDESIAAHKPLYVHCWGGVGRTGTVVGCYLIRHGMANSQNVLDVIHQLREKDPKNYRASPETHAQVEFVKAWQNDTSCQPSKVDRYLGCLSGLAIGDAVGTTLEFQRPGSFSPIEDMVGGGPFRLNPGEWTDDTSMALCLADSLIQCQGFDARDQMNRYCRWRDNGYLSSNGTCFDIGGTVSSALSRFQETGDPFAGFTHARSAGNGSIMRLAPIPLFFAGNPEKAILMSAESSKTTHGARNCIDACRYFSALIIGALNGESKETILSAQYAPVENLWTDDPLCPEIAEIALGSFKKKNPPEIRGTGYVVESLEAALWAFHRATCFEDGCLLAVNLGDDADTTGAVYGQIAGAFYGFKNTPAKWRDQIAHKDMIADFAVKLFKAGRIQEKTHENRCTENKRQHSPKARHSRGDHNVKKAVKSDWENKALPKQRTTVPLERNFSDQEMAQIRNGVLPIQMEDKWFIYFENDKLFFHRSRTGFCVYIVYFTVINNIFKMVKADLNRDPDQYKETDDVEDAKMISYLIDLLLLHKNDIILGDGPLSEDKALKIWSLVGRAALGEHPNDD